MHDVFRTVFRNASGREEAPPLLGHLANRDVIGDDLRDVEEEESCRV